MPFQKGHKKIGGKKPGSSNKKSVSELIQICDDLGIDPFTEMLKLAKATRDEGIKVSCYKECAKYLYSQQRAVEMSGPEGKPIEIESSAIKEILADFSAIINTKVDERKD